MRAGPNLAITTPISTAVSTSEYKQFASQPLAVPEVFVMQMLSL